MAEIQKLDTANFLKDLKQQQISFIVDGNANWHSYFGKQFDNFIQGRLSLSEHLYSTLHSWFQNYIHTNNCLWMFLAAFLIIGKH
jgi:hypothetical protein